MHEMMRNAEKDLGLKEISPLSIHLLFSVKEMENEICDFASVSHKPPLFASTPKTR